jgi:Skp family chaperone for outer membrane proteins
VPPTRLLGFLLLAAVACQRESSPASGVVDVREAFQRSPLAMVSALQLEGELGSAQRELKKRGRTLAKLRQQVAHGGLDLDVEQRAQVEEQLAEEAAQLAKLQREYLADLEAAQQRHGEAMVARVEEVARELARERGLVLLFRRDGALYREDGSEAEHVGVEPIDLTGPVIRALLARINPTKIPEAAAAD